MRVVKRLTKALEAHGWNSGVKLAGAVTAGAVTMAAIVVAFTGLIKSVPTGVDLPKYILCVRAGVIASLVLFTARQWVVCLRPDAPSWLVKVLLIAAYALALALPAVMAVAVWIVPLATAFADGKVFDCVILAASIAFAVFAVVVARRALARNKILCEAVVCAVCCCTTFVVFGIPVLLLAAAGLAGAAIILYLICMSDVKMVYVINNRRR